MITKAFVLAAILIASGMLVFAQGGGKYADAYKKYLGATCPIPKDTIQHFVYFARDREAIIGHPFLTHSMFKGAQAMYAWREFEPEKDKYDFSVLRNDLEYLEKYGKTIFIELQDVSFNPKRKVIPDYLFTDEYNGGATLQYHDDGKPEGWVAKRWNKKVRERFALLMQALGKEFDGKIAGINLQETSIGVSTKTDSSFTEQSYVEGLKENMLAMKKAFPKSTTMLYANFMPGEWLPMTDKGYLRSLYEYGEKIGVGLGGPDLMVTRRGQLHHALKFMHEGTYTVPIGIAVQDGNYFGQTGDDKEDTLKGPHKNIVPLLHAFAKDFLRVSYIFWANQQPYFNNDVLPCFLKND
jgi:hypothetical protein